MRSGEWKGAIIVFVDTGNVMIKVFPPLGLDERILRSLAPWIEDQVESMYKDFENKMLTEHLIAKAKWELERRFRFRFEVNYIVKGPTE